MNMWHFVEKSSPLLVALFSSYSIFCVKNWKLMNFRFRSIVWENPSFFKCRRPNMSIGLCFWGMKWTNKWDHFPFSCPSQLDSLIVLYLFLIRGLTLSATPNLCIMFIKFQTKKDLEQFFIFKIHSNVALRTYKN